MTRLWLTWHLSLGFVCMMATSVHGDEGLWLFNNPPRQHLKTKHGFDISDQWLEHLQKASVRFNSGGSGSFVSPDGLVMTNHHVGVETLQKLSTREKDYVKDGFWAKNRDEEAKAVDLELNVLMEIEDVSARVKAAVTPEMSTEKAFAARRAVIAQIEEESQKKTGLRSNVTTLYQGGQYHLYRFKRYTDVRLVFAPEQQIAFFGGDPDNFSYPRYDLDICFFRVYEDGKPAKIDHYLKWNNAPLKAGELVFVSGHPGKTSRLNTVAELENLRDVLFPFTMRRLNRQEVILNIYSAMGAENERRAKDLLFGVANYRKALDGMLAGLQDPLLLDLKRQEEKSMREALAKNPELKDLDAAWDAVAATQKIQAKHLARYVLLEIGHAFRTPLFDYARTLVRAADEFPKPNDQRLSEFGEAQKKPLELRLFSGQPLYPDFELYKLEHTLGWMTEILGFHDPLVQRILNGKSPRQRAVELIGGTKLFVVAERQKLYKGGKEAIDESTDTMIALAKMVDEESRKVRHIMETKVEEPRRQAYDKIARARFALQGTNTYPDATFTLRLSFGLVKGYEEKGTKYPHQTTFAGLYFRNQEHNNRHPFDLPARWLERKSKLNLKTGFNFVCTADIIGGNSGSPVVNRQGEIVGIIFDGNIQSLVWDFIFTEEQARAVSVCAPAIVEALRNVYDAHGLADELVGNNK